MENETEVIKQQMEETRTALSEKLEAVEDLVASTVKETTETVTETVAAVTDKVESTVNTVTDTVSDSVESVKQAFDITGYVEQYPWLSIGAAAAAGYALGCLMESGRGWTGPSGYQATGGTSFAGETARAEPAYQAGRGPSFLDALAPVIDKFKGLAIGTAIGLIGDTVVKNLPDNLRSEVSNLIDETTRNLGGTVVRND
jgi:ElaB/YqjD/DUF883 family membrane-anchored ribosome-binding protein